MPVIREAVFEDCWQVADLQRKFGLEPDTPEDWERLWVNNPAKHANVPIGWILEEKKQVVGFLGNVSRSYDLAGKEIKAVAARGWVVEPDFRNMTVLLLSKYLNQKNVDILLNSSSNDKAYHVFVKMGSRTVPLNVYEKLLFWVTNGQNFITSVAAYLRMPPVLSRGAGLIGAFFSALPVWGIDYYMNRKITILSNRYVMRVIEPDMIGDEFDRLWEIKRSEHIKFLADRSSSKLKWHFSKEAFDTRIICCYEQGELKGYLAIAKMRNGKTDFIRYVIIDLIALNDSPLVVEYLIASAYKLSRSEKAVAMELLGFNDEIRKVVKGMKAMGRKSFPTPFTFKLVNKDLSQDQFEKKDIWYPSLFDGDSSL